MLGPCYGHLSLTKTRISPSIGKLRMRALSLHYAAEARDDDAVAAGCGRRDGIVDSGRLVARCTSPPTTQGLAKDAAAAMGGLDRLRGLQTVVMKGGSGTRLRLGQMAHATDEEMPASLANVVETLISPTGAPRSTTRSRWATSASTARRC
jgi:hypothetical protein